MHDTCIAGMSPHVDRLVSSLCIARMQHYWQRHNTTRASEMGARYLAFGSGVRSIALSVSTIPHLPVVFRSGPANTGALTDNVDLVGWRKPISGHPESLMMVCKKVGGDVS